MQDSKSITINTLIDRDPNASSSETKCKIYLSQPVQGSGRLSIACSKVVIPSTNYTFHPTENLLWYVLDPAGTPSLKYVSIPTDKAYPDAEELASDLTAEITSQNGDDILVEYLEYERRLKFTNNTGGTMRFISNYFYETSFGGQAIGSHANEKLGLIGDLSGQSISNSASYTATGVPRLISTLAYHVVSRQLGDSNLTTTPSRFDNPSIIATVLNGQPFGGIVKEEIPQEDWLWLKFNSTNLSSFDIEVVDDQYRSLDFNGAGVILELRYIQEGDE